MIKKFISFNESKYYGDLYHNIRTYPLESVVPVDYQKVFDTLQNISKNGLKFLENKQSNNGRSIGKFKFLVHDYSISVTRDIQTTKSYGVSLVLDGEKISERYRIEPFNLLANLDIKVSKYLKSNKYDGDWRENPTMVGYKSPIPNSRHWSEEKILSKSPGYLDTKYIKKILVNKPSNKFLQLLKGLETDIEISIK